jgi:hypothetical protein
MLRVAETRFRRLNAPKLPGEVALDAPFTNGVRVNDDS